MLHVQLHTLTLDMQAEAPRPYCKPAPLSIQPKQRVLMRFELCIHSLFHSPNLFCSQSHPWFNTHMTIRLFKR